MMTSEVNQVLHAHTVCCQRLLTTLTVVLGGVMAGVHAGLPLVGFIAPVAVLAAYSGLRLLRRRLLTTLRDTLAVNALLNTCDDTWVYPVVADTSALRLTWLDIMALVVSTCAAYDGTSVHWGGVGMPCLLVVCHWIGMVHKVSLQVEQQMLNRLVREHGL